MSCRSPNITKFNKFYLKFPKKIPMTVNLSNTQKHHRCSRAIVVAAERLKADLMFSKTNKRQKNKHIIK